MAAIILASCTLAWVYLDSWIPLVIGALIIGERVFEFAHIPSTKKAIGSFSVAVTESGILFQGGQKKCSVLYPWGSLMYKIGRTDGGSVETITIEDTNRKMSKVELTGYEEMGELYSLIEANAGKS